MTYTTSVEAVRNRILASPYLQGFGADDVAIANYDLMNGSHKYIVVLDYDGMAGERAEFGPSYFHTWNIQVTLGVLFQNAVQAHDDLAALRDHVLVHLGSRPDLAIADNLTNCLVSRGQTLEDLVAFAGNAWQLEILTVQAKELVEY